MSAPPRFRLSEIIAGQARATAALERALATGRLFPSLVFHGAPGTGKLATALALARALLCGADPRPCDACRTCRRLREDGLVHPDLFVAFPETRKQFLEGAEAAPGVSGIDAQERQAETQANAAWSILIDRVREAIAFVQRRPVEGARSVLILDQAHRMDAPAANALLKVLEEPPPHAVIVLTAASVHALLPTIRSRCQAVPFRPAPRDAITAFLVERHGMAPEEAVLRAGLASGRVGAALSLDLDTYRERREAVLALLEELLRRGDPGVAVTRAEGLAKGATLEPDLDVLISLVRDLTLIEAAGGAGSGDPRRPGPRLVHLDLAARLGELAPRLGERGPAAIDRIERVLESIRHRGNRQLLVEDLLLELVPQGPPAPA
jgi:DNA polymerase-3 subunit delta'